MARQLADCSAVLRRPFFLFRLLRQLQRGHVGAEGMNIVIGITAQQFHLAARFFDERPRLLLPDHILSLQADLQGHDHQAQSQCGADSRDTSATRSRLRAGGRLAELRQPGAPKRFVAPIAHVNCKAGWRFRAA